MRLLFVSFITFCYGLLAAAGVFTVFVTVGLVPRFALRTKTEKFFFLYEEMIILGAISGGVFSVFSIDMHLQKIIVRLLLGLVGLFSGIFVGCLALAIAEMLDSIPIFMRRTGFSRGMGIAIAAMAVGKMAGSLIYFFFEI